MGLELDGCRVSVLSVWVKEQARKHREAGLAAKFRFGPEECEERDFVFMLSPPPSLVPDWSPILCTLFPFDLPAGARRAGPLMDPSLSKGDDCGDSLRFLWLTSARTLVAGVLV